MTYKLTIDQKPGFPVKVFPTVAAAEEWLLSIPEADTQNPHR